MKIETLIAGLRASRAHLNRITDGLEADRLLGPKLAIVNPPLWEIGHVAWFQEYWCLRRDSAGVIADSIMRGADALYDSSAVAHDTRWDLPLPDLRGTRAYQAEVLARVIDRVEQESDNADLHYLVQLATFHEDMHAEAFHYTRQTLAYEAPSVIDEIADVTEAPIEGDVELAGGSFELGARPGGQFVFDNEKWAHEVELRPYRIARCPVSNREYAAFVDAGGYARREWWSDDGWSWRLREKRSAPTYWISDGQTWLQRRFNAVVPLAPLEPIVHVNWHEAQAYCRYANRRLPTEAEWEHAASSDIAGTAKRRYPWGDEFPSPARANLESAAPALVCAYPEGDSASGCRQMIGNIWEWTTSTFEPYPGFVADPYKDYSQPWFHTHKVLRGGSFATTRRLIHNTWRNFYTPDRYDPFAGFRTCASDA